MRELKNLQVGVAGSGVMAIGLVEHLLCTDFVSNIFWFTPSGQDVLAKKELLIKKVKKNIAKENILEIESMTMLSKLKIVSKVSDLGRCDIIHEATHEDFQKKKSFYKAISTEINSEELIVASNTSSFSIEELSDSYSYKKNFLGIHFFNPVSHMKLVEVISGKETCRDVLDFSLGYVSLLKKSPVLVQDFPGFAVNRILIPMINESISALSDGVATVEDIDKAMKLGANHPIGPFALADLIGLDVVLSILVAIYEQTGNEKYKPHVLLMSMVESGLLGKKNGQGFYKY